MGLDKELTDAEKGFALIASYPQFHSLPIILSEADPEGCAACSAKENPANGYRNGPLYASYTVATMKALFALQDRYKVNLLGMVTWSFEFEDRQYFEGFRTLATNGVDKPVLNFFRLAGMMSGQRVATTSSSAVPLDDIIKSGVTKAPDIDAFATRSGRSAAVMLWNYQDDDVLAPSVALQLDIAGLPANLHNAKLRLYRIDQTHSNAFAVWQSLGSPQNPTSAQYSRLVEAGYLAEPETLHLDIHQGQITLPASLPSQATLLVAIDW